MLPLPYPQDVVEGFLADMTSVYSTWSDTYQLAMRTSPEVNEEFIALGVAVPHVINDDLDETEVLLVLDERTSHQVAYAELSDREEQQMFINEYAGWGLVPRYLHAVLESAYVDAERKRHLYGLRSKHRFVAKHVMQSEFAPDVDHVRANNGFAPAAVIGLYQLGQTGAVNGIDTAQDDLQEFFERARPLVETIKRTQHSDQRRARIYQVMFLLQEYTQRPEDDSVLPERLETILVEWFEDSHWDHTAPDGSPEDAPESFDELEGDTLDLSDIDDIEGEETAGADGDAGDDGDEDDGRADSVGEFDPSEYDINGDDFADEYGDLNAQFGADGDSTVEGPPGDHEMNAEAAGDGNRLSTEIDDYGEQVEERLEDRDEYVERHRTAARPDEGLSEDLRARAEEENIISDLEDGFRELVTRSSPRPDTAGDRIDVQNIVRRASGDMTTTRVFEEPRVVETGDRCVGLALDISGSMDGSMGPLKIATGAIAEATDIIDDEFVCTAFTDNPDYEGTKQALDLRIVTGPSESFEWEHLDAFTAAQNEPTAAGIRDCRMLMQQTATREDVLIVITDGKALVTEDGRQPDTDEPVREARAAVNECRRDGYEVIGLGLGDMDDDLMRQTFGHGNYRLTDIDSLVDDILDLYREQMNTL